MLILEALGDVGKLLDRVDEVKASLEASCEALSQANAALQAQSAAIDARIATLRLAQHVGEELDACFDALRLGEAPAAIAAAQTHRAAARKAAA